MEGGPTELSLDSLIFSDCFFLLRRPMTRMAATVNMAPRTIPEKTPAATAAAGNCWQCSAEVVEFETGSADFVGDAVVDVEEEALLAVLDALDVDEGVFRTQLPSWHEYPFGQQLLPHVSSFPVSSVLCIPLPGDVAAFCLDMSQLMGAIFLQSCPLGQHIADLLLLNAMHC